MRRRDDALGAVRGAQALLVCTKRWSGLKAWGTAIARRRGLKRAISPRPQLAVILHRMWLDGSEFRFTRQSEGASA